MAWRYGARWCWEMAAGVDVLVGRRGMHGNLGYLGCMVMWGSVWHVVEEIHGSLMACMVGRYDIMVGTLWC